jgi:hypothetical protein
MYFTGSWAAAMSPPQPVYPAKEYDAAIARLKITHTTRTQPATAVNCKFITGGDGGTPIVRLFCSASAYDAEHPSANETRDAPHGNAQQHEYNQHPAMRVSAHQSRQGQPHAGCGRSEAQLVGAGHLGCARHVVQTEGASGRGGHVVEPRAALEMQARSDMAQLAVACVPLAPLMCSVATNPLVVVLGVGQTLVAPFPRPGPCRRDPGETEYSNLGGVVPWGQEDEKARKGGRRAV